MTAISSNSAIDRWVVAFEALPTNSSGAPSWLQERREASLHRFTELGFPTTRQEKWRFTNVKPIVEHSFSMPSVVEVRQEELSKFLLPDEDVLRLVFVNGVFNSGLSSASGDVPSGVRVQNLATALEEDPELVREYLEKRSPLEDDGFAALNAAFSTDGAFVHVPPGVVLEKPIELLYYTTSNGKPAACHPRNLFVVGSGSSARVVETYAGRSGDVYLTNAVTEAFVDPNGRLDSYRVQRESDAAYHVAHTYSVQGRDTWYSSSPLVFGGALTRHDVWMELGGDGGEGTLNGLYVVGGKQHVDHNTVIEHATAHCDSHEYFNGIIDGHARAVFNGRIIVRPGAQKTDSKQTNNNLLLSKHARADSQPQLEIYADDVKCTHGATLGPMDEDSIFYLKSRGIDAKSAREMMMYGFGIEILDRIAIVGLRSQLEAVVKNALSTASGQEER